MAMQSQCKYHLLSKGFKPLILSKIFLFSWIVLVGIDIHTTLAQDTQIQAFGYMPKTVPDSLYTALDDAKSDTQKITLLSEIASKYLTSGNGDSVVHYAQLLKKVLETTQEPIKPTDRIFQKRIDGDGKYLNGLYAKALESYLGAIALDSTQKQDPSYHEAILGVGRIYLAKGELEKAFSVLEECTAYGTVSARAHYLLGIIYFEKKDYEKCRNSFTKAQNLLIQEPNPKLQYRITLNLGQLERALGNTDEAFGYFENVINASLQDQYYDVYTEAVVQYGRLATDLSYFDQAEMTLSMAYTNAIQWNRLELQKKIINSLRKTYEKKGDYQNAYNLMTQYLAVSNRIQQEQNSELVQELEVKYQTLRKENQILALKEAQLEKENEIDRQTTIKKAFLYGFLVILVPILALLYVYYQKLQTQSQLNLRQKELSAQKMNSLIKENELEVAKSSLNAQQEERRRIAKQLHDSIGSNLAGIKLQLANLKESDTTQHNVLEQIDQTYELVRDISHDLIPKRFKQDAFTTLVQDYLKTIEEASHIQISFSAYPEHAVNGLKDEFKVEIYSILQELITNTLKHAKAKTVEVHLNLHDSIFQLLYEDDGIGFDQNKTARGIGLENVKERLGQLSGNVNIDSVLNRGTAITIEIPVHDHAA